MPIDCKKWCNSERDNMEKILITLNKIRDNSNPKRYESNSEETILENDFKLASEDLHTCLRDCEKRISDGQRGSGSEGGNRKYIRKTKGRSSRTQRRHRKKTTRGRRW